MTNRPACPYHEETLIFETIGLLRNWTVARCVEMNAPYTLNEIDELVEAAWDGRDKYATHWTITLRFGLDGQLQRDQR